MKKILSAICPILTILLLSNISMANEYDYLINKFDIDLNFKRNNTIYVKEKIDASFNKERSSISRKINLENKKLDSVETNYIHVIQKDTQKSSIIKIVDYQNKKITDREFSLNYTLISKDNLYGDDFRYDIIDGSWERNIDEVNFKISLPEKQLRRKKIEFLSSISGVINNEYLKYTVNGNTISGSYNKPLSPHETLTLRITPIKKRWFSAKPNQLILNNVQDENITVYEGDEIIIRLNANPTTGFVWKLSAASEPEDIVTISEENFIAVKTSTVGSGGVSEFKVKTLKAGKATVTGIYIRPWMKYDEDEAENRVQYKIEIKKRNK